MPKEAWPQPASTGEEVLDEGLRLALTELRDRFKCNGISGCLAERKIHDFGWKARPFVERLVARSRTKDRWRARSVRIIAELEDPAAAPFLLAQTADQDDAGAAYALYGLALIDGPAYLDQARQATALPNNLLYGMRRLSGHWLLHRHGKAADRVRFAEAMKPLAQQVLASSALRWGLYLCMRPETADCSSIYHQTARHPAFVVRRQTVRAIAVQPVRSHAPALMELINDPVPSLARKSRHLLHQIAPNSTARTFREWQNWWRHSSPADLNRDAAAGSNSGLRPGPATIQTRPTGRQSAGSPALATGRSE